MIPFNKPYLVGKEYDYIKDAFERGTVSGDGYYTHKCHALLKEALNAEDVLLTTSCTHALEMAALLLRIQPGDEVIVPAYTFVSTVNAFVVHGAKPVFCDIREDTLNLDERHLEQLITDKTKAVVPVHYAGVACAIDEILSITQRKGVALIEDNAHGLFATYKGKALGTFGVLGAQSFHETKNFSCGEGGALIVNDPQLKARAEIIREKGTNRSSFYRGEVDKYTWKDVGSSYLPSDILAAFLFAQLEQKESIQNKRKAIWIAYFDALHTWANNNEVRLPLVPQECEQAYHMFYMILPTVEARNRFITQLKDNGVHSVFHYRPLHLSDMGMKYGGKAGDCPVCEDTADRLVRLPFYNDLSEEDQGRVIEEVLKVSF